MNFNQFPKIRTPLPDRYITIQEDEYLANRTSGDLANKIARKLEGWMHAKVADTAAGGYEAILEVGAGSLNHVTWWKKYSSYDVVEPFQKLLETSGNLTLIRKVYSQLIEIPREVSYDRIISITVLEHMLDLPMEIALSGIHLRENGLFCAGVPSEGCLLWYLAWKYGTGIAFKRRTGLDYSVIIRHEHVNTVHEIVECVQYFYRDVSIKRFPLPAENLSLYTFLRASNVEHERCERFIKSRLIG